MPPRASSKVITRRRGRASPENIAEAHLIVLTSGGVPEGQTLDYK